MAKTLHFSKPGTAFVGREHELTTTTGWLTSGETLLTITGPPGIGKTRLARHFLETSATHPDGLFIELASARTARELADRVAHSLEVELHDETRGHEVADAVGHALAQKSRMLLVLDNFEQLALQARHTLAAWLETASGVTVVVTSREALRLPGERVLELAPLELPPAGNASHRVLADSEAGKLFLSRAEGVRLGESEVGLITQIVRRLEGIPLAIELAANQLRVFGPLQLLRRLGKHIDLTSHRHAPDSRHRTLSAAIGWSWDLLAVDEQSVLAQLAVFRGGFTAEAAEAVVSSPSDREVTTIVAELVDKSLVRSRALEEPAGVVVLSIYGIIGDYARSIGGFEEELATATERHLRHYHQRARQIAGAPIRRYAAPELAPELDNLVAAVEHSLIAEESKETLEAALEILIAMEPIVLSAAPLTSYPNLIGLTVKRATEVGASNELIARTHLARARVAQLAGRLNDAHDDVALAASLIREAPTDSLLSRLALRRGVTERLAQEQEAADRSLSEALAAARRTGDKAIEAETLLELARLDGERDRVNDCLDGCRRAIALALELGNTNLEADARTTFLFLYALTGRTTDARREYIRFARVHRRARLPRSQVAVARINVAIACHEAGRFRHARGHFERALESARALGAKRLEGGALDNFGAMLLEQGDLEEAFRHCERALSLHTQVSARRHIVATLAHLGTIEAQRDRLPEAVARFRDARATLASLENQALDIAVEVFSGHVDLARARLAMRSEDRRVASEARRAVLNKLELVRSNRGRLERQEELRMATRLLVAACRRDCFVVSLEGDFLAPPGEPAVSLANRPTLCRLLATLVEAFSSDPGKHVALGQLMASVWPGERMQAESATNRLHVAITTLRKLGLRKALARVEGGYLLDPSVGVISSDALEI